MSHVGWGRKVKERVKSRRMCEGEFGLSFCIYRVLERWLLLILCTLHGASLGAYIDKETEKKSDTISKVSFLFIFIFIKVSRWIALGPREMTVWPLRINKGFLKNLLCWDVMCDEFDPH